MIEKNGDRNNPLRTEVDFLAEAYDTDLRRVETFDRQGAELARLKTRRTRKAKTGVITIAMIRWKISILRNLSSSGPTVFFGEGEFELICTWYALVSKYKRLNNTRLQRILGSSFLFTLEIIVGPFASGHQLHQYVPVVCKILFNWSWCDK